MRSKSWSAAWVVVGAAYIALCLKVWLDLTTLGTNDVYYWARFSRYIYARGSFSIYRDLSYYNHPPLVSAWLWLLERLTGPNTDFPWTLTDPPSPFAKLLRAPAILADIGSTALVWSLAQTQFKRSIALMVSCVFALSPILIMVSGFHGNTDPLFMFLILLALYAMIRKQSWFWSAVALGLAMNIKLVPIIMIPAFFFWIRQWRTRMGFLGIVFVTLALGYGYHVAVMTHDMIRNVFMYGGLKHIWGIERFWIGYDTFGRAVVCATITGICWLKGLQAAKAADSGRRRYLLEAFSSTFICFLVFTPGFGVQYLSWCVAPLAFIGPWASLGYSVLGGIFLFRVYTYWSGGFPWHYANADFVRQWVGIDCTLDKLVWEFLCIVLAGVLWKIGAELFGQRAMSAVRDDQAQATEASLQSVGGNRIDGAV